MKHRRQRTRYEIHQSIIAWLFALASLCERSVAAPAPVRFMVLWALRGGEVIVRDYAWGLACDAGYHLQLPEPLSWQDDPCEAALHLAHQFRVLAEVLQFLSAWVGVVRPHSHDEGHGTTLQRRHVLHTNVGSLLLAPRAIGPQASPAPDTS